MTCSPLQSRDLALSLINRDRCRIMHGTGPARGRPHTAGTDARGNATPEVTKRNDAAAQVSLVKCTRQVLPALRHPFSGTKRVRHTALSAVEELANVS